MAKPDRHPTDGVLRLSRRARQPKKRAWCASLRRVAPRYDLMNDLMSAGVHRLWKNALVDVLNPRPGEKFLDVAGGTGDIAFRIAKRQRRTAPTSRSATSTRRCSRSAATAPSIAACCSGLTWTTGDAEDLPFPDRSFDGYTIAFGLRNVTDIDKALREALRVLKPGGRFYCLEFSKVTSAPVAALYDAYSERALPLLRPGGGARCRSPTATCMKASAASRRSASWQIACARRVRQTSPGAT